MNSTQASRYTADVSEERAIKTRIAMIYATRLDDLPEAIATWQSILDLVPDAEDALVAPMVSKTAERASSKAGPKLRLTYAYIDRLTLLVALSRHSVRSASDIGIRPLSVR